MAHGVILVIDKIRVLVQVLIVESTNATNVSVNVINVLT